MIDSTLLAIFIAIIAAVPGTIGAFASLRQGRRNEVKMDDNTKLTAAIEMKVNSNLEAFREELAKAYERQAEALRLTLDMMTRFAEQAMTMTPDTRIIADPRIIADRRQADKDKDK